MQGIIASPIRCLAAAGFMFGLAMAAQAHDKSLHQSPAAAESPEETVRVLSRPDAAALEYFTDTQLRDQSDQPHRFFSDLLHDKVVVVNAFFTRCENSCPVAAGMMLQLQDHLGDRLGDDVHFLSISVDPEYDTVDRLRAYADKLGADPAWHFLTGSKEDVFFIHSRLGTFGPNSANIDPQAESHGNNIFMANLKTGLWKKIFAPAVNADQLALELDNVLDDTKPQ